MPFGKYLLNNPMMFSPVPHDQTLYRPARNPREPVCCSSRLNAADFVSLRRVSACRQDRGKTENCATAAVATVVACQSGVRLAKMNRSAQLCAIGLPSRRPACITMHLACMIYI